MAYNTINWGKVYCVSEFGDDANLHTVENLQQPQCLD